MFDNECEECGFEADLKYDPDVDKKLCTRCREKLNDKRQYEYAEPEIQRYGYH